MVDKHSFHLARERVLSEQTFEGGIGTLSEKTLHKILKNYVEPDYSLHEVEYLGSVADIKNGEGIFEIQTASYEKLAPKLNKMLPMTTVTVVCPIIVNKTIRFINKDTGEISPPKKSPKHETALDAFRRLYRIRQHLGHNNLRVRLVYLSAEEYKYLDGWDKTKRKGATRVERIPTDIHEDVTLTDLSDCGDFFPEELLDGFTAAEFSKAIKRTPRYAYTILRFFMLAGVIAHIGNDGRKFIYKRI